MRRRIDPIVNIIRKQRDCEFSLKFILKKENGQWKNVFTMLELVKKGTRAEATYDYGQHVLGERLMDVKEGLELLSSLCLERKEGQYERGNLAIPDYVEFVVEGLPTPHFVPSRQRYGVIERDWSTTLFAMRIRQTDIAQRTGLELLKEGLPYYPNSGEAAIAFFDLPISSDFTSYGEIHVIAPDYRARIESLRLLLTKVEMKLHSPEVEYKELALKVFGKKGSRIKTLPDIYPKSESVGFDVGFQPDMLSVVLLSRPDNLMIDRKQFTKWRVEEGVTIERPEEEIISLTRAGESQNLEYKSDALDEPQKNDLIESVVAFSNTNKGAIMIGVDDKGNIVGSRKGREDIIKTIHDGCDPPPASVTVEERDVAGKTVILVEVPEGNDKPYQSRRDKNFYIRHNANDMRMERSELLRLLEKSTGLPK